MCERVVLRHWACGDVLHLCVCVCAHTRTCSAVAFLLCRLAFLELELTFSFVSPCKEGLIVWLYSFCFMFGPSSLYKRGKGENKSTISIKLNFALYKHGCKPVPSPTLTNTHTENNRINCSIFCIILKVTH